MTFPSFKKRLGAAAAIFLVAGGICFVPRPAYAQFGGIVFDPTNFVVNSSISAAYQARKGPLGTGISLDSLAWLVAKVAIQSMTRSMVNWINSGFNGSPAFVTDLEGHLRNVGDAVAGQFIYDLGHDPAFNSPFQSLIAQSVGSLYYIGTSPGGFKNLGAFTLNRVAGDTRAYLLGDFRQGGWNSWNSAFFNQPNNPYGARMLAEESLGQTVDTAVNTALHQLDWGNGFLSWCGAGATAAPGGVVNVGAPNSATTCRNADGTPAPIQTPGSVIASQINKTLGTTQDQLVTADEFNEIIGALMSQLVNQVVGGTGLRGVSSVSAGGRGFIDTATNPAQYTTAAQQNSTVAAVATDLIDEANKLSAYKTAWGTIQTAAQAASQTVGGNCATIQNTLTTAQAEMNRADAAVAKLGAIQTEISQSAANGTPTLGAIQTEFSAFLADVSVPSAANMAYANAQLQNNTGTLLDTMNQAQNTGTCPP